MHPVVPFLPQIISEKAAQSLPVPLYHRVPRRGWSLREGSQDGDNRAACPVGSAGGREKGFWGKKGEKEFAKAEEGKALGHGAGGGDRSRSGVQNCITHFGKGKAENSEDALALRHVEKYI